jgi:hypothetical protein
MASGRAGLWLLRGPLARRRNIPRRWDRAIDHGGLEDAVLKERGERFEHSGRCRRVTLARVHPEQPAASAANVSHGSGAAVLHLSEHVSFTPSEPTIHRLIRRSLQCHFRTLAGDAPPALYLTDGPRRTGLRHRFPRLSFGARRCAFARRCRCAGRRTRKPRVGRADRRQAVRRALPRRP